VDPAVSPSGFSLASRTTNALIFRQVAGLPVLPRMDLAAQQRRTISRCHRRIVSGVTSSPQPLTPRFRYNAEQGREQCPVRPVQLQAVRMPPLHYGELVGARSRSPRFSTPPHTGDSRSHVITLVIRRKTNRRHMISDHHGRVTDIATSLHTATDGILGTHRWLLHIVAHSRPVLGVSLYERTGHIRRLCAGNVLSNP